MKAPQWIATVGVVALVAAFLVTGVGLTVELRRGSGGSEFFDYRAVAAGYWLGVGSIVFLLGWLTRTRSRSASVVVVLVTMAGCATAIYWLSYEQVGAPGRVAGVSAALLLAVAAASVGAAAAGRERE